MANADWIELRHVSKSYGHQNVLTDASLGIGRGEFLAVVGRSGSGKSTLLRLVGGLEPVDAGTLLVDGVDLGNVPESERAQRRRRDLGFVFQFFNLIPTLTVAENVELPLALNAMSSGQAQQRSRELLRELGLHDCAERFPDELSGGEQQRVAIARAVIHEPRLVLADEPTGNLDVETAGQVLELLRDSCRQRNATLVMATHSAEAAALADRIVTIRGGQLAAAAP